MGILSVAGDFFIKLAGNTKNFIVWKWFYIGYFLYSLTTVGWFFAMKELKLSTIGVFYGVSTILFLVLLSVFYFKESINWYEILGVCCGFCSMILLWKFA